MPPKDQDRIALDARLKAHIASTGPLSVADYMAACLGEPGAGYYASRQPIGRGGDFITAPEVSQIFGEMIGLWALAVWQQMGEPSGLIVAELGPGRGTLMSDCLRVWRRFPRFCTTLAVALVETGEALRQAQQGLLQEPAAADPPIPLSWHADLAELPQTPLILIANEFLDALPIRQFVRRGTAWRERLIGLDEDQAFSFTEAPAAPRDTPELGPFEALAEDGEIAETRPATAPLLDALAERAAKAPLAALFLDYGTEVSGTGDTLQAVSDHRFISPLTRPGEADLTAHVDFPAIKQQAEKRGLSVYGPMPQGEFLLKLGLGARQDRLLKAARPDQRPMLMSGANRLIDPQQMGVLFKALALTGRDQPAPPPFAAG